MRVQHVHPAEWPVHERTQRQRGTLSPGDTLELHDRFVDGWSVDALMMTYGVARRTVYRLAAGEYHEVEVAGWQALVHIAGEGFTPQVVGRWTKA